MKISEIMNMVIDPRPEVQSGAVSAVIADEGLFARCQTFVNLTEGFGGFTTDEIRLKWERRVVAPFIEAKKRDIEGRIQFVREGEGFNLIYNGVRRNDRPIPERQVNEAKSRFLMSIICGLDPHVILNGRV